MSLGRIFKTIVTGALLLASSLGLPALQAKGPAGPALWKVADKDTTIYLFGTIHFLPDGAQWRTGPVKAALAASGTLVLETLFDKPEQSAQLLFSMGSSPGLPALAERFPPDKREALRKIIAAGPMPAEIWDGLEDWTAAVLLSQIVFPQSGFRADQGVETQLTSDFEKSGKPMIGLETVEQQFGFLDTMPADAQRALLLESVEDPAAMKAQLTTMLTAWMDGDVDEIAATFDAETQISPELRDTLIRKRNQAWTDWIATRLTQPGTIFLAVGAGHLAGPDSVQTMLGIRGIKAQRVN